MEQIETYFDTELLAPKTRNDPCNVTFVYIEGDLYPSVLLVVPLDQDAWDVYTYVECENDNGSLDYMIHAQMAEPLVPGYYVMENTTVDYTRGDGWTTDDDAKLHNYPIRPARLDEIYRAEGSFLVVLWVLWTQIKLAAYVARGNEL